MKFTPQRFGRRDNHHRQPQVESGWVEIAAQAGANRGHHSHRTTNSAARRGSSIWAGARCKYYGGIVGDFVHPTELKCTSNSQAGAPAAGQSAATKMMSRWWYTKMMNSRWYSKMISRSIKMIGRWWCSKTLSRFRGDCL